jgi:CMP/dCMP kinase
MSQASPLIAITIARQVGAGGGIIGRRLAARLGFTFLDSNVLRLAAEKCGASEEELARWDEHRAHFWERLGSVFTLGAPEGMWSTLSAAAGVRDRELFELQAQVIREIAARESCVVIGRAGFWVLRDHPGLVSVYLHAPVKARVPRVMRGLSLEEGPARELIDRIDPDRAAFVREVTGRALAVESQHLCIDTGCVSLEAAEKMIVLAVEERRAAQAGRSPL